MKKPVLLTVLITLILAGCQNHKATETTTPSVDRDSSPSIPAAHLGTDPEVEPHLQVIAHGATVEKKVALTFDDGPDDKYTPKILDILKSNQVKGTFFLVGEHVNRYPVIVKRIVLEGHAIGNHTWDHSDLTKQSKDKIFEEINKTDEAVKNAAGISPSLFRAPYGAVSTNVLAAAETTGHKTIGWSVDTLDWDGKSVSEILHNVRNETHPGAIILQHSAGGKGGNLDHTLEALPQIIHYLKQKGYTFVTVPQLLQ